MPRGILNWSTDMAVIPAPRQPTHVLGAARFTSLATPSRGSRETAVWSVEIAPHAPAIPHSLTREEVFVVVDGTADVELDGHPGTVQAGDAIVVPADVPFALSNRGELPLRMLCCLPVGGQGRVAGGVPFTLPWAE